MMNNLNVYGRIASKRIADNVPMAIENILFEPLTYKLKKSL